MSNFAFINKGLRSGMEPSSIDMIDYGFEAALVIDVITNDDDIQRYNKLTSSGYEIGCVKFKNVDSDINVPDDNLLWAFPMDSNYTEYPLINEIVIIYRFLNRIYYTRKLNISNRPTASPMYGLHNETKLSDVGSAINTNQINPTPAGSSKPNNILGLKFKEDFTLFKLRHREGDIVIEGRHGNSIRIGSDIATNVNANIFLRAGQTSTPITKIDGIFALIDEDINKDSTSLYLTENERIGITPATKGNFWHQFSMRNPTDDTNYTGAQIVGNSDRIIFNTKKNEILLFSNTGIYNTANLDFTIDSGRDYISYVDRDSLSYVNRDEVKNIANDFSIEVSNHAIYSIGADYDVEIGNDWTISTTNNVDSTAGVRHSLVSPKIYIGTRNSENEPIPCGYSLAQFLVAFVDAHLKYATQHGISAAGPVALNPAVISELTVLKMDLMNGAKASFNSTVAFTTKIFEN